MQVTYRAFSSGVFAHSANPAYFIKMIPFLLRLSAITGVFCIFLALPFASSAQCFVREYPGNRRVLKIDGDFVLEYSSYKRLYKFDGEYLVTYPSYRRLLKFDGNFIIRYSDYRRIARLDGDYLINYANYRRIAQLDCPGRRSALAAAAYFLL